MKKILVPCDFSRPAVNAFRMALDMAAQSGGTVYVLHVIELPALHDSVLMPALSIEKELLRDLKTEAGKRFERLKAKYNTTGVKIISHTEEGAFMHTLLHYAQRQSADLIVMGSHGVSGLKEYFVGSNAEKVVRHSPLPVLVVKDFYKGPVRSIVFPNTLAASGQDELVAKVKALQLFFKAHLHVVWINTPACFHTDHYTSERLEHFAKRYALKDYTLSIYNHISEEEGILLFTEKVKGNLIAMGTHGRKGIAHLVAGSKAEGVVNRSKSLLWTYHIANDEPGDE